MSLGAFALTSCSRGVPQPEVSAHVTYNRLGFGPRPEDLENFGGLEKFLEEQLHPEQIDDRACERRVAGLATQSLSLEQLWQRYYLPDADDSDQPLAETITATFLRAIYSRRQLHCLLTEFWHNHFNVYGPAEDVAPLFAHHDRQVIAAHALGNFRTLLESVARSPCMLFYLDNYLSSSEGPNENYAREFLELHTLGAHAYRGAAAPSPAGALAAHYCDNDVFEVARCFTGWTVDSSDLGEMANTGVFRFQSSWHDRFNKIVLGRYLPADQGLDDALQVLDLVASHPATARNVCEKLCRRLLADEPPTRLIEGAARLFRKQWQAPDQLRQVVGYIARSPEFARAAPSKLKRPFDYTVSLLRATSAQVESLSDEFLDDYALLGQPLFGRVTPDGYPDRREDWTYTGSLVGRFYLATRLIDNAFEGISVDVAGSSDWEHRMLGGPLGQALPDSVRSRVRLLAMSPQFQLR